MKGQHLTPMHRDACEVCNPPQARLSVAPNRLQSPKRYFLDAPKEQPGTCFVKNDDYVLAIDEIERLQRENEYLHRLHQERTKNFSIPMGAAEPPCATHAAEHRLRSELPCPWCVIDELKANRDRAVSPPSVPLFALDALRVVVQHLGILAPVDFKADSKCKLAEIAYYAAENALIEAGDLPRTGFALTKETGL
jgi:hypothetical protein